MKVSTIDHLGGLQEIPTQSLTTNQKATGLKGSLNCSIAQKEQVALVILLRRANFTRGLKNPIPNHLGLKNSNGEKINTIVCAFCY